MTYRPPKPSERPSYTRFVNPNIGGISQDHINSNKPLTKNESPVTTATTPAATTTTANSEPSKEEKTPYFAKWRKK